MIDLLANPLPATGSGSRGDARALAAARDAEDAGVTMMVCAPPLAAMAPADVHAAVERLAGALGRAGSGLRLAAASVVPVEGLARLGDDDLRAASLDGAGRWLLLRLPERGWPLSLPSALADLEIRGYRAIVAGPERADAVQRSPDRLREAVGRGALVLITAAALSGADGPAPQRTATALIRGASAHLIGSGASAPGAPGLADGLAVAARAAGVYPEALSWMVDAGPEAILEGRPVRPPRLGGRAVHPRAAGS
ncbi:MAG: hypothetical protein AB7V42_07150 [Thermoleophilia bacterium]